jgi:aspartate kinase
MLKVVKFGGSSMADAAQLTKVKNIVESDPARRVVVVSAAGKRNSDDHKITDLLYLCHAHIKYGVEYESIFNIIRQRYIEIKRDLNLDTDIEVVLDEIEAKMKSGISQDELVSRGEYLAARLMADLLGFDFLDSSLWLKFKFDGSIDQETSYETLAKMVGSRKVVIPGFYGSMPDGTIKVLARGGSDITGALAAAALDADVYENWTDVSGILMADPKIVKNPKPI